MSGPWEPIIAVGAVTVPICTYVSWFVRMVVRTENAKQLEKINGTYIRSMDAKITGAEIERRLEALEHRPNAARAH